MPDSFNTHDINGTLLVQNLILIAFALGLVAAFKAVFVRKPPLDVELSKFAASIAQVTGEMIKYDTVLRRQTERLDVGDRMFCELKQHVARSDEWRTGFEHRINENKADLRADIHELKMQSAVILGHLTKRRKDA